MKKSSFQEFKEAFKSAITRTHKPIIWLECFDFNFVVHLVEELCNEKTNSIKHESVRIWHCADLKVRNWDNKIIGKIVSSENVLGDYVVIDGKYKKIDKLNTEEYSGKKRYSLNYEDLTLGKSVQNFTTDDNSKLLIARISAPIFENDYGRIIDSLQEFAYQNERIKNINDRKSIVLVLSYHFEVNGLEHICERLMLPVLDIEDIDEEFGFIQDSKLKTQRDEERDEDNLLYPKEDKIRAISSQVQSFVDEQEDKNGNTFYVLKDDKMGLIRRAKDGKVERIILPRNPKYKFAPSFLEFNKQVVLESNYQELADSLCGMYLYDIQELLSSIMAEGGQNISYELSAGDLPSFIKNKKKQIVNNTGLLEVVDYEKDYWMQVADIDKLISYVVDNVEKRINNPSNYPPNAPKPKGLLLVGAPGCGKSESAKAIASKLDKPLYRLNIGSLLGHKYGQSENRFIEALRTADASAPCVLWIDEIEKAFAGAGNESDNDDTLTHIVGYFLTWMQEHKTMVYLVATANDVSRMKPEMLREGRWDKRFFLTYPSIVGCIQILYAILEKKFDVRLKCDGNDVFSEEVRRETDGGQIVTEFNDTTENGDKVIKCVYVKHGYDNLEKIAKKMNDRNMSGAEIESILIKGIATPYCKQLSSREKWTIDIKGIEEVLDTVWEKKESKSVIELDEKNYFLRTKVLNEIRDLMIRNLGKVQDIDKLKELLLEKYREQYAFEPASNKE